MFINFLSGHNDTFYMYDGFNLIGDESFYVYNSGIAESSPYSSEIIEDAMAIRLIDGKFGALSVEKKDLGKEFKVIDYEFVPISLSNLKEYEGDYKEVYANFLRELKDKSDKSFVVGTDFLNVLLKYADMFADTDYDYKDGQMFFVPKINSVEFGIKSVFDIEVVRGIVMASGNMYFHNDMIYKYDEVILGLEEDVDFEDINSLASLVFGAYMDISDRKNEDIAFDEVKVGLGSFLEDKKSGEIDKNKQLWGLTDKKIFDMFNSFVANLDSSGLNDKYKSFSDIVSSSCFNEDRYLLNLLKDDEMYKELSLERFNNYRELQRFVFDKMANDILVSNIMYLVSLMFPDYDFNIVHIKAYEAFAKSVDIQDFAVSALYQYFEKIKSSVESHDCDIVEAYYDFLERKSCDNHIDAWIVDHLFVLVSNKNLAGRNWQPLEKDGRVVLYISYETFEVRGVRMDEYYLIN